MWSCVLELKQPVPGVNKPVKPVRQAMDQLESDKNLITEPKFLC